MNREQGKGCEHFIVAYQLKRNEEGWFYERETEESPPSTLTCPKKFLTLAVCINEDWRNDTQNYAERKLGNKALIRALFKSKERGQKLQVTLTAKTGYVIMLHDYALKDAILYVVSVWPGIEGRFPQNGLRYSIPLRLVTDVRLVDRETKNHDRHADADAGTLPQNG